MCAPQLSKDNKKTELITCVNFDTTALEAEFNFNNKSLKMIEPFLYMTDENKKVSGFIYIYSFYEIKKNI
jgi:hypothetical protein